MDNAGKFYITTPIYYVNARPHIGHTYTTVVCDAIARRQRMMGLDTWFLTGTDEHGQKIERSAAAAGCSPREFVDQIAGEFRGLWDRMKITYDDFIRTTEPRHVRGVQALFTRLQERGYIYKGSYSGQYCIFDELYVDAVGPGAPCPECGRPTETVHEENYFFKLSAMEGPLLKYYAEHPDFIRPETRHNEVATFVRGGLRDLSVSRTSFKWGIPVPNDPKHVIYVWLDALANYMTAVGFGSDDPKDQEKLKRYWPADVHMIGKEIVRFHCVYWPAFLLAADLPLPKSIIAHGWLLFEESKMSKSRGNIVRSETILDTLGGDALRYFLLREIVFGQDGSFSFDALVGRFNADLANGLGNLASRTLAMISRYFDGEVPYPSASERMPADDAIAKLAEQTIADFHAQFEEFQFSRALETAWALVAAVNKYIVENEPWTVAERDDQDSRARLATILYTSAEALRIVTALVHPVIPDAAARIWQQLGLGDIGQLDLRTLTWGQMELGTKLGVVEAVFPRADKSTIERMQQMEQERSAQGETTAKLVKSEPASASAVPGQQAAPAAVSPLAGTQAPAAGDYRISIDDFAKVDMRVGEVKVAEKVKGADKLLRLEVDIGTELRQVVAGIANAYEPEKLIGRKVVIVTNLRPRKLRGLESNGMIVAASLGDDGQPVLAGFLEDVPVGARLKYRVTDSHAHLDGTRFDVDRAEVVARAQAAGVTTILAIGNGDGPGTGTLDCAIQLARQYEGVYATVGIHPHEAALAKQEDFDELDRLARDPKVIAWGEIGLDYFYDHSPRHVQQRVCLRQMEMARAAKLPIVIHCRPSDNSENAWDDLLHLIRENWASSGLGGVLHCFTGTVEHARAALDLGFVISFAGNITYPKAQNIRDAAAAVPLDRMFIETDCPYLAPVPYRGQRNEPAYVIETARQVGDLRRLSHDEVGRQTSQNFHSFSGLQS